MRLFAGLVCTGFVLGIPGAHAATEAVLYSFKGGSDGSNPGASLIIDGGVLYGTTSAGGSGRNGTVFSMTTSGVERVLHAFKGVPDGAMPVAPLVISGKLLAGTTEIGGASNNGTVFKVNTAGREVVVYSFNGGSDGANPVAGLTMNGKYLYGTTTRGGLPACSNIPVTCGTVFSISPQGSEALIHAFGGGPMMGNQDGAFPQDNLISAGGKLYGTTYYGGAGDDGNTASGVVFSITPDGAEAILHTFVDGSDGGLPVAGLINVQGIFYGTTLSSGDETGAGTVFSVTPEGAETVLHTFGGTNDGASPYAGLVAVGSTLYGTTSAGGTHGQGTVFSISLAGKEKVIHSFGASGDGAGPVAGLVNLNGTLYGTTSRGGTANLGTVFSILP